MNCQLKTAGPPVFRCRYNDSVGTIRDWNGFLEDHADWIAQIVTEVVAYESIATPYGSFPDVMKMKETSYDSGDNLLDEPEPRSIGWMKKLG